MKKNTMYFMFYGEIEHIDKKTYLRGPYRYVCTTEGADGGSYDIVRDKNTDQEYYTEI